MKVGELLALLGEANKDATVQVCQVDEYFTIDAEFCGYWEDDAGRMFFIIEVDEQVENEDAIGDETDEAPQAAQE